MKDAAFILAIILLLLLCHKFSLKSKDESPEQTIPNPSVAIPQDFPSTPEVQPDASEEPQNDLPAKVEPDYVQVPEVRQNVSEDSLYADIMNRQSNPFQGYDRDTNAHETSHGIHADLRNRYKRELGKRVNGFYVGGGRGVIIEEPKIRKREVIPFLPPALRSYRYNTYISGQSAWDDTPLYLVDEWVCYVNGGAVAVESVKLGKHNGERTDAVSGCVDFTIYCVALAMAIEKGDPDYWKDNDQYRRFMQFHLERAYTVFNSGRNIDVFRWEKQEKLLESLRTAPAAADMRSFLSRNFNGIWLND